jgi:hypothetical protein
VEARPKAPGRTISLNLSKDRTFAAARIVLTPSVRNGTQVEMQTGGMPTEAQQVRTRFHGRRQGLRDLTRVGARTLAISMSSLGFQASCSRTSVTARSSTRKRCRGSLAPYTLILFVSAIYAQRVRGLACQHIHTDIKTASHSRETGRNERTCHVFGSQGVWSQRHRTWISRCLVAETSQRPVRSSE